MRIRLAAVAFALSACTTGLLSGTASAAPNHNHGLTINVTPHRILAGDGVLIYGQLNTPGSAGQTILLYHRLLGSGHGFTLVGTTKTDLHGFYEFTRAEGVVMTNRVWFVRELGGDHVHSRTVGVRVEAVVGVSASTQQADTRQWVEFTGQVDPNHAGEPVLLQQQIGGTDDWRTLKHGRLDRGSFFHILYRWQVPGEHTVRVLFRRDVRNVAGESDPITITIQQAQHAGFTISTSKPIVQFGQGATISGVLGSGGAATGNVVVSLWGRIAGQHGFSMIGDTTTMSDGSYTFNVTPQQNTIYQVRTAFPPHRRTAVLFEGVRDVVTLQANSLSATVGATLVFTGNVTPNKDGDVVYLQRQTADGDWQRVAAATVQGPNSTFQFAYSTGTDGQQTFRARVPGDPANVGGASPPVTVTVTLPPLA